MVEPDPRETLVSLVPQDLWESEEQLVPRVPEVHQENLACPEFLGRTVFPDNLESVDPLASQDSRVCQAPLE